MKLYKISIGHIETYAVGEDAADVFQRKAEYDPSFDYLPIAIEEITVEGYDITVSSVGGSVDTMNRDQLKQYLTERAIEFVPQWGDTKLRELALSVA
jgi:hypothetical protein